VKEVYVDDLGNATAAAEGALLSNFKFQPYKAKKVEFPDIFAAGEESEAWKKGVVYGNAQNFCKTLMDTPANYMTPTIFCDTVKAKYEGLSNVELQIHDEAWAKKEKMNLYLSVSAGSSEPPKFLEITYNGNPSSKKPIALVGKGITFDSGGISLKPGSKMDQMRADMGGAANVASAIWALASLKVKVNVKGFIPLCENMPGNKATKPGDVIIGRNGKSVCIDNTDAEGRLILADALSYASDFNPLWTLDIATLTGAVSDNEASC
jgi:aminopeptidase